MADVLAYTDRMSYLPGDDVDLMVSADAGTVDVSVTRLVHADTQPRAMGLVEVEVPPLPPRSGLAVDRQPVHAGSFAAGSVSLPAADAVSLGVWVYPTLPGNGRQQGIAALLGDDGASLTIRVDEHGRAVASTGGTDAVAETLEPRRWHHVEATSDGDELRLTMTASPRGASRSVSCRRSVPVGTRGRLGGVPLRVLLAATRLDDVSVPHAVDPFNGKLEDLTVGAAGTVVRWRLPAGACPHELVDVTGHAAPLRLENYPTTAVTGHRWTGAELDFRYAPDEYTAVHFHDDDLEDACWRRTARFSLPPDLRSGVYCARIDAGEHVERVPFFVNPVRDRAPDAEVLLVLPTFTYQAYCNTRLAERLDFHGSSVAEMPPTVGRCTAQLRAHPEVGSSLYDVHSDGSGVSYSSERRPNVLMRPDYVQILTGQPRHLPADLYLVAWLESLGVGYDVATDHELHDRDAELLTAYAVVLSGTHPEYTSARMLDAYQTYVRSGGHLQYLGGNGFYQVTGRDEHRPWVVEVRRGTTSEVWRSAPGESFLSTTGEPGGEWYDRGWPPQATFLVGMAGMGYDRKAPGYVRAAGAGEVSFLFAGVDDEVIGDFGLVMDGASGDEIDRADVDLGTPRDTVVAATSQPHSPYYVGDSRDAGLRGEPPTGDQDLRIRSDVCFLQTESGGSVFAVGSISWAASLACDGFGNNVARLNQNVLEYQLEKARRSAVRPEEAAWRST